MKFFLRSVCLFLLVVSCSTHGFRPNLGPGVIHLEETHTRQLGFYNKPDTSLVPIFKAHLYYQDTLKRISTSLRPFIDTLKFNPLYLLTNRNVLTLRVIEQNGDWYKVYTNESALVAHWVCLEGKSIEGWQSFWPSVRRLKGVKETNPLRKNPEPKAEIYHFNPDRLCLKVVEMQDTWLKVKNAPERCPDSYVVQEEFEGFIRWIKEGEILVNFSL